MREDELDVVYFCEYQGRLEAMSECRLFVQSHEATRRKYRIEFEKP